MALRANPLDIREQYEKQLKELQQAYGEACRARVAGAEASAAPGFCSFVSSMLYPRSLGK